MHEPVRETFDDGVRATKEIGQRIFHKTIFFFTKGMIFIESEDASRAQVGVMDIPADTSDRQEHR
jgi:hypothetical protein